MSFSRLSNQQKQELNLVCIIRDNKYDPSKLNLIEKVTNQNSILEKVFDGELKSWPLYSTPKIYSSNDEVFILEMPLMVFANTSSRSWPVVESAYELFNLLNKKRKKISNLHIFKKELKGQIS